jgi:hypothetical protein
METVNQSQSKEEKKREYMRTYMKQYKAKKYNEDPESIRRANRTRYLKRTHADDIDANDRQRYGTHLADIIALRELINRIPNKYIIDIVPQLPLSSVE